MKNLLHLICIAMACFQVVALQAQTAGGDMLDGFEELVESQDGPREPTGSGTSSGHQSGGGATTATINGDWLSFSKIVPVDTRLEWTTANPASSFIVSVSPDDASSIKVFSMKTTAQAVTLPISDMDLKLDQDYVVQIETADGSATSPRYAFSLISKDVLKKTLEDLKADTRYQQANEDHRILMKAFVLENLGLYSQALEMYNTFRPNDASDTLFRNMKDRFLERLANQ